LEQGTAPLPQWVKGCRRDCVCITSGAPQVADDLVASLNSAALGHQETSVGQKRIEATPAHLPGDLKRDAMCSLVATDLAYQLEVPQR
jgi:hypothetical protein